MRFYLTVLIPKQVAADALELAVDELMAPYDSPESYEQPGCRCAVVFARHIATEVASKLVPEANDSKRFSFGAMFEWWRIRDTARAINLRYLRHSPTCVYCRGSGRYSPEFEPTRKFDSASFGGLDWTGWIRGQPRRVEDFEGGTLEDNLTTVAELLDRHREGKQDIFTNSLLTPDGEWYSADFGFRLSRAKLRAFDTGFVERLERHKDCWAIGLECHY